MRSRKPQISHRSLAVLNTQELEGIRSVWRPMADDETTGGVHFRCVLGRSRNKQLESDNKAKTTAAGRTFMSSTQP